MLTGMDVFSTQVVALRHKGPLRSKVKTLQQAYDTLHIGDRGEAAKRQAAVDKVGGEA